MNTRPSDGEGRKAAAMDLLRVRRERYVKAGCAALLTTLLREQIGSIDSVRAVVTLPSDVSPKLFGAVSHGLRVAGLIELVDYEPSRRPDAHARPISRWRLTDPTGAAARRWLEAHPVPPETGAAEPVPTCPPPAAGEPSAEPLLFDLGDDPGSGT